MGTISSFLSNPPNTAANGLLSVSAKSSNSSAVNGTVGWAASVGSQQMLISDVGRDALFQGSQRKQLVNPLSQSDLQLIDRGWTILEKEFKDLLTTKYEQLHTPKNSQLSLLIQASQYLYEIALSVKTKHPLTSLAELVKENEVFVTKNKEHFLVLFKTLYEFLETNSLSIKKLQPNRMRLINHSAPGFNSITEYTAKVMFLCFSGALKVQLSLMGTKTIDFLQNLLKPLPFYQNSAQVQLKRYINHFCEELFKQADMEGAIAWKAHGLLLGDSIDHISFTNFHKIGVNYTQPNIRLMPRLVKTFVYSEDTILYDVKTRKVLVLFKKKALNPDSFFSPEAKKMMNGSHLTKWNRDTLYEHYVDVVDKSNQPNKSHEAAREIARRVNDHFQTLLPHAYAASSLVTKVFRATASTYAPDNVYSAVRSVYATQNKLIGSYRNYSIFDFVGITEFYTQLNNEIVVVPKPACTKIIELSREEGGVLGGIGFYINSGDLLLIEGKLHFDSGSFEGDSTVSAGPAAAASSLSSSTTVFKRTSLVLFSDESLIVPSVIPFQNCGVMGGSSLAQAAASSSSTEVLKELRSVSQVATSGLKRKAPLIEKKILEEKSDKADATHSLEDVLKKPQEGVRHSKKCKPIPAILVNQLGQPDHQIAASASRSGNLTNPSRSLTLRSEGLRLDIEDWMRAPITEAEVARDLASPLTAPFLAQDHRFLGHPQAASSSAASAAFSYQEAPSVGELDNGNFEFDPFAP